MNGIRQRAEELVKGADAVDRVEQLLRNQVCLDEKGLREAIENLGFDVVAVGDGWCITYPSSRTGAVAYRVAYDETASDALKKVAAHLREKADALEVLVK